MSVYFINEKLHFYVVMNNKLSYTQINKMLCSSDFNFQYITTKSIQPMEMYRDIFSSLELSSKGHKENGKYNLICLKINRDKNNKDKNGILQVYIYNQLKELEQIIKSDTKDFCILSCISYAGKTNNHSNARFMYALVIDLDDLIIDKKFNGIHTLDIYCGNGRIKTPNYIVSSGHGLHLYYVFDKPIPLYQKNQSLLFDLKKELVKQVWTNEVSASKEQHGNIIQGFRVGGTYCKDLKHKAKCFKVYDKNKNEIPKYTPYELAQCCINFKQEDIKQFLDMTPKNQYTIEQAKKLFPTWYEKRIIKKEKKGKWHIKRALYDWWLRKIKVERKVGHRYYCCLCLVIYAIKCDIDYEELKKDLYDLQNEFDFYSDNPFTKQDINDALKIYNDNIATYTRARIELLSDIPIPPNKRNGRTQKKHIEYMNTMKKFKYDNNECLLGGRKEKKEEVLQQIIEMQISKNTYYDNSKITIKEIMRQCKISKPTAIKYRKMFYS